MPQNQEIQALTYVSPKEMELLQALRTAPVSGYQPQSGGQFIAPAPAPAQPARTAPQQTYSTPKTTIKKPLKVDPVAFGFGSTLLLGGLFLGFQGWMGSVKADAYDAGRASGIAAAQSQINAAQAAQLKAQSDLQATQAQIQAAMSALQQPVAIPVASPAPAVQ